ncbi:hypothetical protein PoB_002911900 [Plakobranchus ocellatus]|uniref:Uncharacterized protein n=1 Tax=Plakobranchus ocellatus TaxID=259542 RepID=A0AAV4A4K4_9GAST|nr:hypothetical protein PoB_002911900 [Plakobranchus ocellatus]
MKTGYTQTTNSQCFFSLNSFPHQTVASGTQLFPHQQAQQPLCPVAAIWFSSPKHVQTKRSKWRTDETHESPRLATTCRDISTHWSSIGQIVL